MNDQRENLHATRVDSPSDDRTANNAVRHTYRVLSEAEKVQMVAIKDKGAELLPLSTASALHPANRTEMAWRWGLSTVSSISRPSASKKP